MLRTQKSGLLSWLVAGWGVCVCFRPLPATPKEPGGGGVSSNCQSEIDILDSAAFSRLRFALRAICLRPYEYWSAPGLGPLSFCCACILTLRFSVGMHICGEERPRFQHYLRSKAAQCWYFCMRTTTQQYEYHHTYQVQQYDIILGITQQSIPSENYRSDCTRRSRV